MAVVPAKIDMRGGAERERGSYPSELVAPMTVAEIELTESRTVNYISIAEADHGEVRKALVLVRMRGRPMTTIIVDAPAGRIEIESCTAQARTALDGTDASLWPSGDLNHEVSSSAKAPPISIVIATRERVHSLERCLNSLAPLDYPNYEVIVVDNAPVTDETAQLIRHWDKSSIRYIREDRRGLAAAHNRGLQEAQGRIVAFTDDDVVIDKCWLQEIADGFQAVDGVACVTGLIMAAELQTKPQVMLETHGNFSKGFRQRVFDLGAHRPDDPLFPFTVGRLGSGANMAFDREKMCAMGGFDPATGTGTIARGGDDLAAFFTVIANGFRLVYQPTALVWHHHRRDLDSLAAQAHGYGVGLGAYLTSSLCRHPASIGQALRRTPSGLAYAFSSDSPRNSAVGHSDWPRELTWLERRGLLAGPFAYARSRWKTRGAPKPFKD